MRLLKAAKHHPSKNGCAKAISFISSCAAFAQECLHWADIDCTVGYKDKSLTQSDNKCLGVVQAMTFAKDYATKNGPILMEMDTYRYHGHSMSDPGSTYRTRDEISQIRQSRDPLEHVRKLLTDNNLASTSELKAIEKASCACWPSSACPKHALLNASAPLWMSMKSSQAGFDSPGKIPQGCLGPPEIW